MSLLTVSNMSKRFGGLAAVDDVSLSINKGEIYGLIGPNGAGKTTCFNLITGLYPADRGRFYCRPTLLPKTDRESHRRRDCTHFSKRASVQRDVGAGKRDGRSPRSYP